MLRFLLALAVFASISFSATIVSSAEEDCSRPFVQDTIFSSDDAFYQRLNFCKDYGETLGVAAVKLDLKEASFASHLLKSVGFQWKWSNPYYNDATAMLSTDVGAKSENGYFYLTTSASPSKRMAYSLKDADQLMVYISLDFMSRAYSDTVIYPAVGDTLHWTLSFIYFHSSRMPIWSWSTFGTADAWKGSDTMTVRYRTIMQEPYPSEGLAGRRQGSPDGPVLGRYDLQGRPLHDQSTPRGLIFERTKQGFRKRLQLR